ncbi:MAG: Diguanylate cyclase [Candidatus Nitrospira kreftii]|uniref:Diguanylate cyclase n=1 Tax=Candidatus Nitrospira kreftii TaxID=2652173 RepID=A0A7S8FEN5_9BACT|nr:MAG: Diguanylate cyclase [Candidatus Nitrospira kreftii]
MIDPALLVRSYLLYFILPLWVLVGLTDYFLHKQTHIEENSGTKESVLHVLQLGEAGIPVIVALLFEINALVIGVMLFALIVHEATALWGVYYAHTRRYISPWEQHVHSFLEVLPIMAVSFVTVLYWNQFLALLGLGTEAPRFVLEPKADPLPFAYLVALFSSIALFIVVPYGEELWRCISTARRDHTHQPSVTQSF